LANKTPVKIQTYNRHKGAKAIRRAVINVGSLNATLTDMVDVTEGLDVKVLHNKVVFAPGVDCEEYVL
jgi:hypothetical protein